MEPTIKIKVGTTEGPAVIASLQEFNTLGGYAVAGPGKRIAKEWIENATGAFGHTVGQHAAPCDLHAAAMDLQEDPEVNIWLEKVEGEIKEYDSGIPEGSVA